MKYAFIKAHRDEFSVRTMCCVLKVYASEFCAWLKMDCQAQLSVGAVSPALSNNPGPRAAVSLAI